MPILYWVFFIVAGAFFGPMLLTKLGGAKAPANGGY